MKRVIANIRLLPTSGGGPELEAHGYDCRLLLDETGQPVPPGGAVDGVAMVFLSPDDVIPHMHAGVQFLLWEGKTIGSGTVVRVDER